MKTKTADLTGPALDWAVARCQKYTNLRIGVYGSLIMNPPRVEFGPVSLADLEFSTDWSQGGPIIEREVLDLTYEPGKAFTDGMWRAMNRFDLSQRVTIVRGPTALIAAMRCYVASKLGDEVDVPDELST